MINFPAVNITPATRSSSTQKAKRRVYATEPELEQAEKPFQKDRRSTSSRRKHSSGEQVVNRRVSHDRRKGRINLVI